MDKRFAFKCLRCDRIRYMSRRESTETKPKCSCGCTEFIQTTDERKQSKLI